MPLNRPPIRKPAPDIPRGCHPEAVARQLIDGKSFMVSTHFGVGVSVLQALRNQLSRSHTDQSFAGRQAFQRRYNEASERLIAPVSSHRVALKGVGPVSYTHLTLPTKA